MIVPEFWAEGQAKHRGGGKSVTIRRFGWSDASLADAQAMADTRAAEALARQLAGEDVRPRDHKRAYNGAEGLPIREEIVARHGAAVVTRNAYGARCLNVPDVLFADVDFGESESMWSRVLGVGIAVVSGLAALYWFGALAAIVAVVVAAMLGGWVARVGIGGKQRIEARREARARARVARFIENRPDWTLALYRTPAGFRLLALHRRFDPNEPAVKEFFDAIGVDRVYARMCSNQHCFRARLTAKPWRIGIAEHLRPRGGAWPVRQEWMEGRRQWIADYEARASGFSACCFVETLGRGASHIDADRIRELHDELSGALRNQPLA